MNKKQQNWLIVIVCGFILTCCVWAMCFALNSKADARIKPEPELSVKTESLDKNEEVDFTTGTQEDYVLMTGYFEIPVKMIERLNELSADECPECGPLPSDRESYQIFLWELPDGELGITIIDPKGNIVTGKNDEFEIFSSKPTDLEGISNTQGIKIPAGVSNPQLLKSLNSTHSVCDYFIFVGPFGIERVCIEEPE